MTGREDIKFKILFLQKKEYTPNEQKMINNARELDEAYRI